MDDVEDGDGEYSLRRRQGRRDLRSEEDEQIRARTHDTAIRVRDFSHHRTGSGYSGAGRLHGLSNDGVDHGHLFHDQGAHVTRSSYRQTDLDRRFRGPERSNSSRMFGFRGRSLPGEKDVAA